jgi:hypothetical protein
MLELKPSEILYSDEDRLWVSELLGREPRGLYKVEKYHPVHKHPMVIKVLPYVKGAPFPTLFWLTCPLLKKEISHIEKDAWIEKIEKEHFAKGRENLELLHSHHKAYARERRELFEQSGGDWDQIPEPMAKILKESGIGGIADFDHIKCFHLHYAHHLVRENQVGKILDEHFDFKRFY